MKKARGKSNSDIRPEYDFASMKGGVRGQYVSRYRAGTNLVLLQPEVARAFPTDQAVNEALMAVLRITDTVRLIGKSRPPAKSARRYGKVR